MSVAATAWAFETKLVQTPLERLVLILLADCTDDFGVCTTRFANLASRACAPIEAIERCVSDMRSRGVIAGLQPVGAKPDPDFEHFEVLYFVGWPDRDPMVINHTDQGPVIVHALYNEVVVA